MEHYNGKVGMFYNWIWWNFSAFYPVPIHNAHLTRTYWQIYQNWVRHNIYGK